MPAQATRAKAAEPVFHVVVPWASFDVPRGDAVEHVQVPMGGGVPEGASPASVAHLLALGFISAL
jgi:hypothetical protein